MIYEYVVNKASSYLYEYFDFSYNNYYYSLIK